MAGAELIDTLVVSDDDDDKHNVIEIYHLSGTTRI